MRICLSPEIDIPWDDSDDTFYTKEEQDDDAGSISSTESSITTHNPHQILPSIQNPYQPVNQPPPQPTIISSIRSWLQPQPPPPPPPPPPPTAQSATPNQPVAAASTLTSNRVHHQTIMTHSHHNHHWGDNMPLPKPRNVFRIISRNVNSLSTQFDYVQWKAAAQAIQDIGADSISLQETNVAWTKIHQHRIRQILHNTTGQATISTAVSSEVSTQSHQRGGTLQALVGDWASRIVTNGKD